MISSAPNCYLSATWLALFSLSIHPLFPSFSSHPLIPPLPFSLHRAVNLRQWQTPTRKRVILIPLCISIMEQLDMKALLSGPSWLTACCIPSVNRETEGKKWGDTGGVQKEGRGQWFGYPSNGINGYVGFKLVADDSRGLIVFLLVIGRYPPITQSLSLCLFHPLLSLPLPVAAIYSSTSYHFCLNPPHINLLPLFFTLWIQYSRQHDVQIKECDGIQWKCTAWCSKSTA